MDQIFLDTFELMLEKELLRKCTAHKMLDGTLLETEDLNAHWKLLAPEYMADAVPEIANYPVVSVAWAAYLGMAVACAWDTNWDKFRKAPYQAYYGEQGFDDMDEHIVRDLLGIPLDSQEAKNIESVIRTCGETAVSMIRHEHIEPQSKMAFYIFTRATRCMFRIGAALELKRLNYKFEKMDMPDTLN